MKTSKILALILALTQLTNCTAPGSAASAGGGSSAYSMVETFAGVHVSQGSMDGFGTQAKFFGLGGSASDGANIYVADSLNNTIRKIVIATGEVTTLAGTAGVTGFADGTGAAAEFNYPESVATDGTNVYVADNGNSIIRQIVISTGVVTTLAGTAGAAAYADGIGPAANFMGPTGVATDGTNVYVADLGNNVIRQIVIATGNTTTIAGTAGMAGDTDDIGALARFSLPNHLVHNAGKLYIVDAGNYLIRQLDLADNSVSTIAGNSGVNSDQDGIAATAEFNSPYSIATDGTNLFVTDSVSSTIRKVVIADGTTTTFAGTAGSSSYLDGTGAAARFVRPRGIVAQGANLYISDTENNVLRRAVIATGVVTSVAGAAPQLGSTNGTGTNARFNGVLGIASDGTNLYVSDSANHTIRKIVIASGAVTTFAGTAGAMGDTDAVGAAARFNTPKGITTDGTNLYVADTGNHTVRKIIIANATVSTLAGNPGVAGMAEGVGAAATFTSPYGVTTDGTNVYVTSNHAIRKIVIASGLTSTLAGSSGAAGYVNNTGAVARFSAPFGITNDGTNLYVVESANHTVRQIVIATGAVTTMAGSNGMAADTDGVGGAARFNTPVDITTDGTNLYVADDFNLSIRKIEISTGTVTTLSGVSNALSVDGDFDGTLAEARFNIPEAICYTTSGLFVGNTSAIRRIY